MHSQSQYLWSWVYTRSAAMKRNESKCVALGSGPYSRPPGNKLATRGLRAVEVLWATREQVSKWGGQRVSRMARCEDSVRYIAGFGRSASPFQWESQSARDLHTINKSYPPPSSPIKCWHFPDLFFIIKSLSMIYNALRGHPTLGHTTTLRLRVLCSPTLRNREIAIMITPQYCTPQYCTPQYCSIALV